MSSVTQYYQGETFRQNVSVTDADGTSINPNTITITIEDAAGTKKITDLTMIKEDLGTYHYDYNIPTDGVVGEWITEVNAEKTQIAIEHDRFLVMGAL